MLKKSLIATGFATVLTIIIAAPTLATIQQCIESYQELSTERDSEHPIKCPSFTDQETGEMITIYADKSVNCAKVNTIATNQDDCGDADIASSTEAKEAIDKITLCVGEGNKYPNINMEETDEYKVRCPSVRISGTDSYLPLWGKTSADCASAATVVSDYEDCTGDEIGANTGAADTANTKTEETKKEGAKKSTDNGNASTTIVIVILIIALAASIAIIVIAVMQMLAAKK